MQLTKTQLQKIEEGYAVLLKYGILYLACEKRTGKTAIAQSIGAKFASYVCFITKKKAMKSIEKDYKALKFSYKIDIISMDSCHKITGKPDLYILDEAHSFGAFPKPSLRTKNLKEKIGNTPVILLSATPTPESFSQIYHQLWLSNFSPFKLYKNFYRWAEAFVNKQKKRIGAIEVNDYSDAKIHLIKPLIEPLMIRMTLEEAGICEDYKENILTVRMSDRVYAMAKMMKTDNIIRAGSDWEALGDTAAKKMSKMHQIFSGTIIDENDNFHIIDTTKAKFIKERFNDHRKVVIFYLYRGERAMLENVLGLENIETIPEEFRDNDKQWFICQFKSGREGINLSIADDIVFLNIDYAYLSYDQTKARIQSYGKEKTNHLWFIFAEKGIENNIYKCVMNKKSYTSSMFFKDKSIGNYDYEQGELF
jgi:hypothetical protein